jgi:hypothetical protein
VIIEGHRLAALDARAHRPALVVNQLAGLVDAHPDIVRRAADSYRPLSQSSASSA